MGTSLGYGQGMEYQYFNAPQPSQALPMLRQARLQQLREERMRRQQRRIMPPDLTSVILRRNPKGPANGAPPPISGHMPVAPPWEQGGPRPAPMQDVPPVELSPARALNLPPVVQHSPSGFPLSPSGRLPTPAQDPSGQLQAASTPAQDTGSIQRLRMGRATLILSASFIASRILGLLRTSMFAFVFGAGATSDAYLQAFLVPDLIFNIVAGGALSSAFIPVFTNYMVGERDEKTAWHIASSALNLAVAIMMGLALFVIIFAQWLVPLYNPGVHDPNEMNLIIALTRIMLLQSIMLGGGVIINSVLNARQNFLLPAIGTVLYNVGLITGLLPGFFLAFAGHRGQGASSAFAVYAATWGVVLGAALQVGIQLPGIFKLGMHYTFSFDWKHPGVIQIGRQMVPRIVNAAMLYFSTFVDRGLILILAAVAINGVDAQGLITQYYQALQLVLLPLGIFGMAVSTAAFPTLAENVTKRRLDRVRDIVQDTLRSILFMSIPSSLGLMVLGLPIIQVLLQHGAYSLADASSTAVPLAFFALGLAGLAAVEILTRSFYALRDSRTPVIVSVAQFVLKIAMSILLLNIITWGYSWGLGALAFSTSIAGLLEAVVLVWLLQQRLGNLDLRMLAAFTGRVVLASLIMGVGILLLRLFLDLIMNTTSSQSLSFGGTALALLKLLVELAAGLVIYVWATRLLGIEEFWKQGPVKRLLERFKLSWI